MEDKEKRKIIKDKTRDAKISEEISESNITDEKNELKNEIKQKKNKKKDEKDIINKKSNRKKAKDDTEGKLYEKSIGVKFSKEFNIDIFSTGCPYNYFEIFVDSKNLSENEINELNKTKNSNKKEIESLKMEYNDNVIAIKNLVRSFPLSTSSSDDMRPQKEEKLFCINGDFDVILPSVEKVMFISFLLKYDKYIFTKTDTNNLPDILNIFVEVEMNILTHTSTKYLQIVKYNFILKKIIEIYNDIYESYSKEDIIKTDNSHSLTIYTNPEANQNELKCEAKNNTLIIKNVNKNNFKNQLKDKPKIFALLKFVFSNKLYSTKDEQIFNSTLDYVIFLVTNKSFNEFIQKFYSKDFNTKTELRPLKILSNRQKKIAYLLENKIYEEDEKSYSINEKEKSYLCLTYILKNNIPCFIMYNHYDITINEIYENTFKYIKNLEDDIISKEKQEEKKMTITEIEILLLKKQNQYLQEELLKMKKMIEDMKQK